MENIPKLLLDGTKPMADRTSVTKLLDMMRRMGDNYTKDGSIRNAMELDSAVYIVSLALLKMQSELVAELPLIDET